MKMDIPMRSKNNNLIKHRGLPGGMNGVADGYNIACPTHIQVGPREGDEARVSHCMLVPTQHITRSEAGVFCKVAENMCNQCRSDIL